MKGRKNNNLSIPSPSLFTGSLRLSADLSLSPLIPSMSLSSLSDNLSLLPLRRSGLTK